MKAEGPRVRIEELRLAGFRAFENTRLALDDLTVLVGRNGAGKSTIIDAFEFLREALTDSLENALERRGGVQAVMRKGPMAGRHLALAVKLRVFGDYSLDHPFFWNPEGQHQFLYGFKLKLHSGRKGFVVQHEHIKFGDPGSPYQERNEPPGATLELPHAKDQVSALLLNALRTSFVTYKLAPSAIRAEPAIGGSIPLNRDGSNVGDVLKRVEKNKEDLDWIVKHLAAITPGIIGLRAGTAVGRRIVQFLQSTGGSKPNRFEIGDMSDGTLRGLAILLALRQRPTPALVCIDEIEDSVHPSALAVLLDAVSASTERCQVLLTSHSPEALSHEAVTARRVRVVDWSAGRSDIFRLSKGAEQISRPPSSVGELLRTNALFTEETPERVEGDFFGGA